MDIAALVVAIVAAVAAAAAAEYARRSAKSAAETAALDKQRRHAELTPHFRMILERANPGHLGAAHVVRVKNLVRQRGGSAQRQERRVHAVDAASSSAPPLDTAGVLVRDPEGVAVGRGHPPR